MDLGNNSTTTIYIEIRRLSRPHVTVVLQLDETHQKSACARPCDTATHANAARSGLEKLRDKRHGAAGRDATATPRALQTLALGALPYAKPNFDQSMSTSSSKHSHTCSEGGAAAMRPTQRAGYTLTHSRAPFAVHNGRVGRAQGGMTTSLPCQRGARDPIERNNNNSGVRAHVTRTQTRVRDDHFV